MANADENTVDGAPQLLTDEQLRDGGMSLVQCWMRSEKAARGAEAARKAKEREKLKQQGRSQLNIIVPTERRDLVKAVATLVGGEDPLPARAFAVLATDPDLQMLVDGLSTLKTEDASMLREIMLTAVGQPESIRPAWIGAKHPHAVAIGDRLTSGKSLRCRLARWLLAVGEDRGQPD